VTGGPYLNTPTGRTSRTPFRDLVKLTTLNVDVVTTQILAEADLSMYDQAFFTFINDGAFPYTVTVTTGEATSVIDAVEKQSITVPAKVGSNPGQRASSCASSPGEKARYLLSSRGCFGGGQVACQHGTQPEKHRLIRERVVAP
jgi:hypothetical protein